MLRLRQETRAWHLRLERELDIERRLASRASYRALIESLHGFYEPFERVLVHSCDWDALGLPFEPRRKEPLLRRDLRALGALLGRQGKPALPDAEGTARALGCLYVLEGSTLGGQIIGRMLRGSLGIGPDSGGAFFASYGPAVGPMWRAFGKVVEEHAERLGGEGEMVAGANETFACLHRWLCEEVGNE